MGTVVNDVITYLESKASTLTKMNHKMVMDEFKRLWSIYGKIVGQEYYSRAFSLTCESGRTTEQYRFSFLSNVVCESYKVFNETHKKYLLLREKILEQKKLAETMLPEEKEWEGIPFTSYEDQWLRVLDEDHERKLRVCKVPIYPL